MSEQPEEPRNSGFLEGSVSFAQRVGEKCVVSELRNGWFCAHGTDGMGRLTKKEKSLLCAHRET